MRAPGSRVPASPLTDHVCHAFDDDAALHRGAHRYLAAGMLLGQRALIVAPEAECRLAQAIAEDACRRARPGSDVQILSVESVYGSGPVPPEQTLRGFGEVLRSALDEGYTGLRVVAVLTRAVTDPELRRAFARWEHLAGRWQSTLPIASACSYDRSVMGDDALHEIACLHPRVLSGGVPVPFQLYFRRGRLVLDGEIDSFSTPLLLSALSHLQVEAGEDVVLDAQRLRFLDHRALLALVDGIARRHGARLVLSGAPAVPRQLPRSLGIDEELLSLVP